MISENLLERILVHPATEYHGRHLYIVSGFATPGMVSRHMEVLRDARVDAKISLVVGMMHTVELSKAKAHHLAFRKLLIERPYQISFECSYVPNDHSVHAKTYVWMDGEGTLTHAFCGSANYTANGFMRKEQVETMVEADPQAVKDFFDQNHQISKACTVDPLGLEGVQIDWAPCLSVLKSVTIPLVMKDGEVHPKSGLNWGHRNRRDRNEAYLAIPKAIRQGEFFPDRPEHFTVVTDDGQSLIMVRAQDDAKALHSKPSNSDIGRYIRRRIGLKDGTFVERVHLERYGRLDVTFFKIDHGTYFMDFRPK